MGFDDALDFRLIGKKVRNYRKMRGMSQEKLAEAASVSVPYVSHIERGTKRASISTLIKLSAALGISVDGLLPNNRHSEMSDNSEDVQLLFCDCSPWERQTLLEIATAVKQILRDSASCPQ